jgi:hypothetical protein
MTTAMKEGPMMSESAMRMSDSIELKIVDLDDIYIDAYQRVVEEKWLKVREGKVDLSMLGTLTLSDRERDGKMYSAIDGQHRYELMTRHGMTQWFAVVFTGLTVEEEAELFVRYQKERRNITPIQRFDAEVVAGKPGALALKQIVEDAGYALGPQEGAGSIKAVVALERIYNEDPAQLKQVLRLIQKTWDDLPYAQNEQMIKGVWTFVKKEPELDEARFIDRLSGVTPMMIGSRADGLRQGRGLTSSKAGLYTEVIENAYRSRARAK